MLRPLQAPLLLAFVACSSGEPILECERAPGARPVCGFRNPEDLALLGGGRRLLVSQAGSTAGGAEVGGSLAFFSIPTETLRVVYEGGGGESAAGWGAPDCPGAPERFNPHGLDLVTRADGRRALLVVNHADREAVEFFELTGKGAELAVVWRGCAVVPEGAFLNDVVGTRDGGFLTTRMLDKERQAWNLLRAQLGMDTGWVYVWEPAAGFSEAPGSAGTMPNGLELSDDESQLFVGYYGGNEVRRIARASGELRASAEVSQPDNLTWARDGRLLVASHDGGRGDQMTCMQLTEGACPMRFSIVALDAETLAAETLFTNEGPPMGAGTVAIDVGDALWIGSFAGDRILRVNR